MATRFSNNATLQILHITIQAIGYGKQSLLAWVI